MNATLRPPSVFAASSGRATPERSQIFKLAMVLFAAGLISNLQACDGTTPAAAALTPCALANDCLPGQTCVSGFCQMPAATCQSSADCGGKQCLGGVCQKGVGSCSCLVSDPCTKTTPTCGDGISFADGGTADAGALPDTDPGTDTVTDVVPQGEAKACATAKDCDDGDACTQDACQVGVCLHPKKKTAECTCFSTADCNDGNACTSDKCLNDQCAYSQYKDPNKPNPFCCSKDGDCVDGGNTGTCQENRCLYPCKADGDCADDKVCTKDVCLGGKCGFLPISNCCEANADCNDNNACTADACDEVNHTCSHSAQMGADCCVTAADCNDKNDCTTDGCDKNKCTHAKADASCCKSNADCTDNDLCTADTCSGGKCVFTANKNCCKTDAACDDGKACTTDICQAGTCSHDAKTKCCANSAECNDNNTCTTDACSAGSCTNTAKPGCSTSSCGDGNCDSPKETATNCAIDCKTTGGGGSCSGKCGLMGSGGCFCTPGCEYLDLCCPDYDAECGGQSAGDSCVGNCGGEADNCYCDDYCSSAGDCCDDFASVCGGSGGGAVCGDGKCTSPKETTANCAKDCKAVASSCVGSCGAGKMPSGCWCNATCVGMKDCCTDYLSVCGGGGATQCLTGTTTCKGKCGGVNTKLGCSCDPKLCVYDDSCCPDVVACCGP